MTKPGDPRSGSARKWLEPRGGTPPAVSIIVPVFNEAATVEKVAEAVSRLELDQEVLFVDDGSRDGTQDILKRLAGRSSVRVLFHAQNLGKGAAIRTALAVAQGQVVIIQDADLEYDPSQIPDLVMPILQGSADAVFGSRFLIPNPNLYKRYLWGNKFLTGLANVVCDAHLTDSYTCYKAMRRSLAQDLHLSSRGFEIEAEISVKLLRSGCRLLEMPIRYKPRSLQEGKKIRFQDAVKGMLTILKTRWGR